MSLVPGTEIMTTKGDLEIEDLVGKKVTVYDGEQWVTIANLGVTGVCQEILVIHTDGRKTIKATKDHKFILSSGREVMAKDLKLGDCLLTVFLGDTAIIGGIYQQTDQSKEVYGCTVPTNNRIVLSNGIVTG